jgi:hypothetical protein
MEGVGKRLTRRKVLVSSSEGKTLCGVVVRVGSLACALWALQAVLHHGLAVCLTPRSCANVARRNNDDCVR